MTSSSSPGISLKQEGISYMAGAELPCVLLNVVRGGPGLGTIQPSQADYFQAVKGGGHGDYRLLVLAPATIQEAVDLTILAFDLADKYRNPVMICGDGMIGQMMEPVEFPENIDQGEKYDRSWAATGSKDRAPNVIKSLFLDPAALEQNAIMINEKYETMKRVETRSDSYNISDKNELLIVAYGTVARICQTAIDDLKKVGVSVGMFRPITLFPYPEKELKKLASVKNIKTVLTVEMSLGQMVEDVEKVIAGDKPVKFFGRTGGIVPGQEEICQEIQRLIATTGKKKSASKTKKKG